MRPVSTVNLPQLWPARCHRSFHSAIQMLPVLPRMSNTIFSRRMSKSWAVVARDTLICKTEASGEKSERNPCTLPIICISLRDSIARRILTLSPKGDASREGEMTPFTSHHAGSMESESSLIPETLPSPNADNISDSRSPFKHRASWQEIEHRPYR